MEDNSQTAQWAEQGSHATSSASKSSEKRDAQLLAAVAEGDDEAFAALYNAYSSSVFNYLIRLVHDRSLAEDLLQETFVAAWGGAGAFRRQSTVKTWLFRIAHNRAVSWLRRHRPRSMDDELEMVDETPGPEMLSQINWRNQALLSALDALSANHRAVVELAFAHELAYSEIAQVMECPVGTVKSRMSYALRHLQRLLIDAELG